MCVRLQTEPPQKVASAENSCSPEGRGDPHGQKGTQRPHHPHELLLRPAGDTPALRFLGPECLLPGPQLRRRSLEGGRQRPSRSTPGPGHAAPLCGPQPDLREPASASEGRIIDTSRGHRACAYGSCHHKTSLLVGLRRGPAGRVQSPPGTTKPKQVRVSTHMDSPLAFDMHCQILNFTIHSTFQLSTHGKQRAFVEGLS